MYKDVVNMGIAQQKNEDYDKLFSCKQAPSPQFGRDRQSPFDDIYFFYRPKKAAEEVKAIEDVRRFRWLRT